MDRPIDCLLCGRPSAQPLYDMPQMPVLSNVLYPSRTEARCCARADIKLVHCAGCGAVFNACFNADLLTYNSRYENSLHFSGTFQGYAASLAENLVERHSLKGKTIVEIGCGQGEFLRLLCRGGRNSGIGFDPGYREEEAGDLNKADNVAVISDHYHEQFAQISADFICCRQVLEHLANPVKLLQLVRRASRPDRKTVFFVEVPNAGHIFSQGFLWDIIYEHVWYFTEASLGAALRVAGFDVISVAEEFDAQYLCAEAQPALRAPLPVDLLPEQLRTSKMLVSRAPVFFEKQLRDWRRKIEVLIASGKKMMLWGAGSKGVTFSNLLGIAEDVPYIVDINPKKTGMFVAGTGQQILAPDSVKDYQPDYILVMNPVYVEEITRIVRTYPVQVEIEALSY